MHHWPLATGVLLLLAYLAAHPIGRCLAENWVLRNKRQPIPVAPSPWIPSIPYPDVEAEFHVAEFATTGGTTRFWARKPGKLPCLIVLNRQNRKGKSLLVFCQGRLSTIESAFDMLESFLKAGHHVLLFNYGGIGTAGRATFRSICNDAAAAHVYGQKVVSGLLAGNWGVPDPDQEISTEAAGLTALLGYSLGGWPAASAACAIFAKPRIARGVLALMDTGTDMYKVLRKNVWFMRFFIPGLLLRPRMNNLTLVQSPFPENKFFAHGELDQPWYLDDLDLDREGKPKRKPGFALTEGKQLWAQAPGILARFYQFRNTSHKYVFKTDPVTFHHFLRAIYTAMQG